MISVSACPLGQGVRPEQAPWPLQKPPVSSLRRAPALEALVQAHELPCWPLALVHGSGPSLQVPMRLSAHTVPPPPVRAPGLCHERRWQDSTCSAHVSFLPLDSPRTDPECELVHGGGCFFLVFEEKKVSTAGSCFLSRVTVICFPLLLVCSPRPPLLEDKVHWGGVGSLLPQNVGCLKSPRVPQC